MTSQLAHRGPDGRGGWVDPKGTGALGHTRLAIIDLSETGCQPMHSPDGNLVISFNGEIYNFKELRSELSVQGETFRGTSDTEVLLRAIAHWGVGPALRRLNGMFAFAVWDRAQQRLWLARDRFGEKPLYYAWHNGVFLFGSELKSIRSHPAFKSEIDPASVTFLVRHNHIPSPYCVFKDVWKLRPGHFLSVSPGQAPGESTAYWELPEVVRTREPLDFAPGDPALIDLVEACLKKSVAQRMVADVPLGAFLSGGIDSSSVVALMQAQSARPIKTFTIGFWEAPFNEAEDAARVARHLGTEHHELYLSSTECLDVIAKLPRLYDEPFADSSQIPTTLVSEFTSRHVKVALSGDAGDEFWGGYNRYVWSGRIWPRLRRIPQALRRPLARVVQARSPADWDRLFDLVNPLLPSQLRARSGGEKLHKLALAMNAERPDDLYRSFISLWEDSDGVLRVPAPDTFSPLLASAPSNLHFVERMMYADMLTYMTDDILCKVDRASMSTGLEVRVPFLDNELVDLAWRMPINVRIRHGEGKWPIRQVLRRYLPEKLFQRPKMGFGIPIGDWLRGPLRGWAEELLSERRLAETGIFNPAVVRAQWQVHLSGKRNVQHSLWTILMFEAWRREWT